MTPTTFRHEALLYAGEDAFVAGSLPFIRDGLAAGEPALVMVGAAKIDRLRDALGPTDDVHFADMAEVGRNPAHLIPAWRAFVDEHLPRGPVRGIGEPIWAGRNPIQVVECQHHESLLNLAFGEAPAWWLLCPYDTDALDAEVVDEARRSHPFVVEDGRHHPSATYRGVDGGTSFGEPLPEAPPEADELTFGDGPLSTIRRFVEGHAAIAGLPPGRAADLVLATNEVVTNSVCHGPGEGLVRVWRDDEAVVCEVVDRGHLADRPLVGRERPLDQQPSGRGLWMANQLCDLVQIRSVPGRTVVRLHMASTS